MDKSLYQRTVMEGTWKIRKRIVSHLYIRTLVWRCKLHFNPLTINYCTSSFTKLLSNYPVSYFIKACICMRKYIFVKFFGLMMSWKNSSKLSTVLWLLHCITYLFCRSYVLFMNIKSFSSLVLDINKVLLCALGAAKCIREDWFKTVHWVLFKCPS